MDVRVRVHGYVMSTYYSTHCADVATPQQPTGQPSTLPFPPPRDKWLGGMPFDCLQCLHSLLPSPVCRSRCVLIIIVERQTSLATTALPERSAILFRASLFLRRYCTTQALLITFKPFVLVFPFGTPSADITLIGDNNNYYLYNALYYATVITVTIVRRRHVDFDYR